MTDFVLAASKRANVGKGVARELRRRGRVPAVLYGPGREPAALSVELRRLQDVFAKVGYTHLLNLEITEGQDGEAAGEIVSNVVIKEVQRDPISGDILHVDFYQVPMDRPVQFTVPIVLTGVEARENDGGIIQHDLREIDIECRPDMLPDHITVDVSHLKAGDVVTVADITPPAGVRILNSPDEAVVSIVLPQVTEEAETEEQEATEPELVGKKKAEEEA
ncbi:MAG: 50S ribosomal protein L25 [Limnochordales bacterium]|nr:50S ribosomal protein L25 [Limnochordales bacterium]